MSIAGDDDKELFPVLDGAFVNPFTSILFCLALVSTDMVFPAFELFGSAKDDFDPLTVISFVSEDFSVCPQDFLRGLQDFFACHQRLFSFSPPTPCFAPSVS
ncbi:MAG: hypothetical protein ACI4UY_09460 [Kiritimatiellia bacterium]